MNNDSNHLNTKGVYRHFSTGDEYSVLGVATHSETEEELVVYQARYGEKKIWVRPTEMFFEKVLHGGKTVPRFELQPQNLE